jgi:hypothetical protein
MVAIIDHGDNGLIIRLFELLHIALLMDPLQPGVIDVINDEYHHLWFIYQNLQSLQGKLVGVIIDIQNVLLIHRLFLAAQVLALVFV